MKPPPTASESQLDRRLQSALAGWASWSESAPVIIARLDAGLTNNNFLLQAGDRQLVLRLNGEHSQSLDLNRQVEASVHTAAAQAGISPALLYCQPQQGYLITEYLSGRPWSGEQTRTAEGAISLAGLLRTIHNLEPVGAFLDIDKKADRYWQSIDQQSALAIALRTLQPKIQRHLQQAQRFSSIPCLCHNDLLADNLIITTGHTLYAIDWEYAAVGDPYFDLAVIVEGHGLDQAATGRLLAYYHSDEIGPEHYRRLHQWRVIYCYLSLLWYGVKQPAGVAAGIAGDSAQTLLRLKTLLSMRD